MEWKDRADGPDGKTRWKKRLGRKDHSQKVKEKEE